MTVSGEEAGGVDALAAVVARARARDDAAVDIDEGVLCARMPWALWRRLRLYLVVRATASAMHFFELALVVLMAPSALSAALVSVAGRQLGFVIDSALQGALEALRRQVRQLTTDGALAERRALLRRWAVVAAFVAGVVAVVGGAATVVAYAVDAISAAAAVLVLVVVLTQAADVVVRSAHAAAFGITRVPRSAWSLVLGDVGGAVVVGVVIAVALSDHGRLALAPWALVLGRATASVLRLALTVPPVVRSWRRLGLQLKTASIEVPAGGDDGDDPRRQQRQKRRQRRTRPLSQAQERERRGDRREELIFALRAAMAGVAARAPATVVMSALFLPFSDLEGAVTGFVVVVVCAPVFDVAAGVVGPFVFDLQRVRHPILAVVRVRLLSALSLLSLLAGIAAGLVAVVVTAVLVEGVDLPAVAIAALSLGVGRALFATHATTAVLFGRFGRIMVVGGIVAVVVLLGFDGAAPLRIMAVGVILTVASLMMGFPTPAHTPFDDAVGAQHTSLTASHPSGASGRPVSAVVQLRPDPRRPALPRAMLRPLLRLAKRRGLPVRRGLFGALDVGVHTDDDATAVAIAAGAAAEGGARVARVGTDSDGPTAAAALVARRQRLLADGYRVVDVVTGDATLDPALARGALADAMRLAQGTPLRRRGRRLQVLCLDGVLVAVAFGPHPQQGTKQGVQRDD
jgi:hypothetical protein